MKIAYILLCHKNPEQVSDLVFELTRGNADVYIHFDKKSLPLVTKLKNEKRIKILPAEDSFLVKWGGNNIVKSTLRLIQEVKKSGKKYDYVWLLSGQDFPIASQKRIESFLKQQNSNNFIEIIGEKSNEYNKRLKLCEVYYPSWVTNNNFVAKFLKRIYMLLTGGFENTFKFYKRRKPFDFPFRFGSQWWCLRSDVVFKMLEYCERNPEYLEYFDNVIVPDECFFQTLFMALFDREEHSDKLTFVNWGNDRRSPDVLTKKDFSLLEKMNGKYCFARKFDIEVDGDIMRRIRKELLC